MQYACPDYYKDFKCTADKCRHNCCIGWEIDIDSETLSYYKNIGGSFGKRLFASISDGEVPHFILGENERCPFLNNRNLCDIMLTLGEDRVCNICADHPRFINELPCRTEIGLGLACEAAGALILGKKTPMQLEITGECEFDDEIIALRDNIIEILQERSLPIFRRTEHMLQLCRVKTPDFVPSFWADKLLSLERLDNAWTDYLCLLKTETFDKDGFENYMSSRLTEYEQILVYFIYRHFANAFDLEDAAVRAVFAEASCRIIYTLGAIMWTKNGSFTFDDQTELVRMFSAEIEYSDENLDILLDICNDLTRLI